MPKVDLRIRCRSCGTEEHVFPCPSCSNYTCRECLTIMDEAGCEHRKRDFITGQKWD